MDKLTTSPGWNVLHLFSQVDPLTDAESIHQAAKVFNETADSQLVSAAILGHKADLCVMALSPDVWALRSLQTSLAQAGLQIVDSFLSLTEISEYAPADMSEGMKKPRLYPKLPPEEKNAFCFYPMTKRRNPEQNWYELPFEERQRLMHEHGASGRNFAGRIVQLVTGATGIDDWEWGVTLFGSTMNDLKECVYTMRYDEASAKFAEFGPFYTGIVASLDDVLREVGVTLG